MEKQNLEQRAKQENKWKQDAYENFAFPFYTALPAYLRHSKELPHVAKLIYSELSQMRFRKFDHRFVLALSVAYQITEEEVKEVIHSLQEHGFLRLCHDGEMDCYDDPRAQFDEIISMAENEVE